MHSRNDIIKMSWKAGWRILEATLLSITKLFDTHCFKNDEIM